MFGESKESRDVIHLVVGFQEPAWPLKQGHDPTEAIKPGDNIVTRKGKQDQIREESRQQKDKNKQTNDSTLIYTFVIQHLYYFLLLWLWFLIYSFGLFIYLFLWFWFSHSSFCFLSDFNFRLPYHGDSRNHHGDLHQQSE